jgi:protein-tyrosine-phosphatase
MKQTVLILCTGNSARSQMAEGLLRHDAGDRFEVSSAGTHPSHVRPEAIEVMREIGLDISGHRSKSVDEFAAQHFDYVLTFATMPKKVVPSFPGTPSASITVSKIQRPPQVTRNKGFPPSVKPATSSVPTCAACLYKGQCRL